ncbi:MAG TPA: cobalt-precorrin 5A hydrolase [Syntrophomonadaceae bacterium]|mgnify:CR=1 FL=1|nr:cobalt-precorrin 5A hydrolase [Syntrophomonadaceae bacterium]
MKCAVISFTDAGERMAKTISQRIPNTDIYSNKEYPAGVKYEIGAIFEEYNRIVFVCAVGIAVRLIAPYIKDKTRDPAVVVVDDLGRYAISLLSGHLGGANDLAREIAEAIGAPAVITTASEGRGIEAVDMFAQRCGLVIENMEDAKTITSIMVNGGTLRVISEINQQINYPRISDTGYDGCLFITSRTAISCDQPYCVLRPKNLTVGVGCRKGKSKDDILNAIYTVFKENDLSIKSIDCLASIDLKKEEQGLIQACEELGCDFKTFTKEQINSVQQSFAGSPFVKGAVGVGCVCEPCAYLASGEIIVGKRSLDGVTVSVGRKKL